MTRDEAKQAIIEVINNHQGCKSTEIPAGLLKKSVESIFDYGISNLLEELVREDKVIEIEYTLPNMEYRIKSFYLPAKTNYKVTTGTIVSSRIPTEGDKLLWNPKSQKLEPSKDHPTEEPDIENLKSVTDGLTFKKIAGSFKRKNKVVQAIRWSKNGDHPDDACEVFTDPTSGLPFQGEGHVVRYYRHPQDSGKRFCPKCSRRMHDHGWIDTPEGDLTVCPGDWIITEPDGFRYPVQNSVFKKIYEPMGK